MIDPRLFTVIQELAKIEGVLHGTSRALAYSMPDSSRMIQENAERAREIGDLLMQIIGAAPQDEKSDVIEFKAKP